MSCYKVMTVLLSLTWSQTEAEGSWSWGTQAGLWLPALLSSVPEPRPAAARCHMVMVLPWPHQEVLRQENTDRTGLRSGRPAAGSGASMAVARHVAPVQGSCAVLRLLRGPWQAWTWPRRAGGRSARPPPLRSPRQGERAWHRKAEVSPALALGWARQRGEPHLHSPLHLVFCPALPSLLPLLAD